MHRNYRIAIWIGCVNVMNRNACLFSYEVILVCIYMCVCVCVFTLYSVRDGHVRYIFSMICNQHDENCIALTEFYEKSVKDSIDVSRNMI